MEKSITVKGYFGLFSTLNKELFNDQLEGHAFVNYKKNKMHVIHSFKEVHPFKRARTILPIWKSRHVNNVKNKSGFVSSVYEYTFREKDLEKFLNDFISKHNALLIENKRLTDDITTLNSVFGVQLGINKNEIITSCIGKGIKGVLKGYMLTDIMNNATVVLDLIDRTLRKKKSVKEQAFKEFHEEMAKLNIVKLAK